MNNTTQPVGFETKVLPSIFTCVCIVGLLGNGLVILVMVKVKCWLSFLKIVCRC